MSFDIDDIIKSAQESKRSESDEVVAEAPNTIALKKDVVYKKGITILFKEILEGVPEDISNLNMKMFGNCTYFPYNPNKTVFISDDRQDIHFRIGDNGKTHCVIVPAGE